MLLDVAHDSKISLTIKEGIIIEQARRYVLKPGKLKHSTLKLMPDPKKWTHWQSVTFEIDKRFVIRMLENVNGWNSTARKYF